jgi:hypothetical protein
VMTDELKASLTGLEVDNQVRHQTELKQSR